MDSSKHKASMGVLLINNGNKFMSMKWVAWKLSRMGEYLRNMKLAENWINLGGNVLLVMLDIS